MNAMVYPDGSVASKKDLEVVGSIFVRGFELNVCAE